MTSTDPDVAAALGVVVTSDLAPVDVRPSPVALPRLPPSASNLPATIEAPAPEPTRAERLALSVRAPAPVKPAVRTTEFWLAAVGASVLVVAAFVLFLADRITQSAFVTIVVAGLVVVALWAVLRTLLKIVAPTVAVPPDRRL